MDGVENEALPELNTKVSGIFSDFMTKIAKFDEMVSFASQLLVGFHQNLEALRRPALDKTSQVVDNILKANQTERVKAYVEAGCKNVHDGLQNINNLNACQRGLQDHLNKAKGMLNELEILMEDLAGILQTAKTSTSQCEDGHVIDGLLHQKEETDSTYLEIPKVSDYTSTMGIIYNLLNQDYSMQEKIVSSLNLSSSSGELESYCLMWSLRPFINDEIMNHAWKFIS